jgi:hypothetical protein
MSAFAPFADEPRWVAWRNEERRGKLTKVPYGLNGRRAKADDPATWISRKEAEARAVNLVNGSGGGVGIQLGDLSTDEFLAGVDLDSCIGEDGCLALWAEKILAGLDTYAERSPSGKGVKAFFYIAREDVRPFLEQLGVTDPEQWGVSRSIPGERPKANHGPGVELYCARRYFAVTDNLCPGKPGKISLLVAAALERLAALIPKKQGTKPGKNGRDTSRSAKAFREGYRLRREGKSFEEFCQALREHDDPEIFAWTREKGEAAGLRELRNIWEKVAPDEASQGVCLDDFWAYMPMHGYIFAPTGEMWPSASVNSQIPPIPPAQDGKPISAAAWLDQNKPVEQMTWAPGEPTVISGRLISHGGWIERPGTNCFNLYRPPCIGSGDPHGAGRWIDHLRLIYPDEADHIIAFLAHRVQRPEEKINHALALGGVAGIGKDTILEPVKYAVGPWNFADISPKNVLGPNNAFAKSVILRISEARDLGEFDRFAFYEAMKTYCAAPPDVLRVNEKYIREYYVPNVCGVIITTNHKTDGMHLPADDRRHFVCWSNSVKANFTQNYWDRIWAWYADCGIRNVAAYLADYNLSRFNPKAAPPQTRAFWEIVHAGCAPENAELADIIEKLGYPDVLTISQIALHADQNFAEWIKDRRNSRRIPHRLEDCSYVAVRNPDADDGLWRILGKRQAIYGKASLSPHERSDAAYKATKER